MSHKQCSVCEGASHHWLPNSEIDDPMDPTHVCKHCDAKGDECEYCEGDGNNPNGPDGPCPVCNGEAVKARSVTLGQSY